MDYIEIRFVTPDTICVVNPWRAAHLVRKVKGKIEKYTLNITFKEQLVIFGRKPNNCLIIPDSIAIIKSYGKTWRINRMMEYPYREMILLDINEN